MSFRNWATAYFHYLTGSGPHRCWDWPALALLSGASWLYRKGVLAKYHSIASHPERQEHGRRHQPGQYHCRRYG